MADLVGKSLLNRYFLRQHVGSGGMADVYAAWDNLRSTNLAVKVLRRDLAQNPRFFDMFAKEADLLRKLEHPNIARLYEFEREGENVFIVMDWVEGTNLRQAITKRKKPYSLEEVSYILKPVTSALHYAHQNKVYHCDVKPANILLHNDGRVLLTDFGVARLAAEEGGAGTPPYMAPEQFDGGKVDERTDVYALGITIYEMVTGGELPFRGTTPESIGTTAKDRIAWEHRNCPVPSPRKFNGALPNGVEQTIAKAMAKERKTRFPTTIALRDAFEHARPAGIPSKPIEAQESAETEFTFVIPRITIPKINIRLEPPRLPQRKPSSPRKVTPARTTVSGGPYLFGRRGEFASRKIPIPQEGFTLGRSAKNRARLSDRSVSRVHTTIIRTKRGVYARDENSSLGTYVNGQRITGPTKLKHRDIIRIGYGNDFEYREK